ncbi:3033_t:CDS:1, partial [Paraglomus occultum]
FEEGTGSAKLIVQTNAFDDNRKDAEEGVADAELMATAPDISPDNAETIKQIPTRLFTDNMHMQRHYLCFE